MENTIYDVLKDYYDSKSRCLSECEESQYNNDISDYEWNHLYEGGEHIAKESFYDD